MRILADLILIILDVSSKQILDHYKTIISVLEELGASRHPTLVVMNKIDQLDPTSKINHLKLKFPDGVFVSALNQLRINQLNDKIIQMIDQNLEELDLLFSYKEAKKIAIAQEGVKVMERKYNNDHVKLTVKGTRKKIGQLIRFLDDKKTSN